MGMFVSTIAALSTFHPEANPALSGQKVYDVSYDVTNRIKQLETNNSIEYLVLCQLLLLNHYATELEENILNLFMQIMLRISSICLTF